ncbi:MAG: hypothetical protein HRK26_04440 [Rickettsiaceae bacterium H1]|nr:hypothetical protein [Rickettsiaceae bacterium H1]
MVLRNNSQESISYNTVLRNGKIENKQASIPSGGFAVIQIGGDKRNK